MLTVRITRLRISQTNSRPKAACVLTASPHLPMRRMSPGIRRHLTVAKLADFADDVDNGPTVVPIRQYLARKRAGVGSATVLDNPRLDKLRTNGDLFLAESETGRSRSFAESTHRASPNRPLSFAAAPTASRNRVLSQRRRRSGSLRRHRRHH